MIKTFKDESKGEKDMLIASANSLGKMRVLQFIYSLFMH